MNREYYHWRSPALGRDMELLVFGHAGARVLVFPTSMGRYYDWESRGLIASLESPIEQGLVQLFCVDSVDQESWYDDGKHPADRVRRHAQYDDYIAREVVPFSRLRNSHSFLISTGASFGGYHAVNFGLRHPEHVGRILSMSGLCDIRRFSPGHYCEHVYFHNPVDFVSGDHEHQRLKALRRMDIILAVGRDDSLRASNERLSTLLWDRQIGNALRIWDGFAHDWPDWAHMVRLYLGGHD